MEVQPLDATWNMSSRVASCTTLTAETAHDRPGSESSNLTTTRTEAHKAAKKPAPNWTDTYLISACLTRPPEPILLPKLRIQFAEFLNYSSLARLRILSSPTCVGYRYGCLIALTELFLEA